MTKLTSYIGTGFKVLVLNIVGFVFAWLLSLLLAVIGIASYMALPQMQGAKLFFGWIFIIAFLFAMITVNGWLARSMYRWS